MIEILKLKRRSDRLYWTFTFIFLAKLVGNEKLILQEKVLIKCYSKSKLKYNIRGDTKAANWGRL